MIFDTQITLRLLSYHIVNGQTTEKLERETTVWAARKSVNRAENILMQQISYLNTMPIGRS